MIIKNLTRNFYTSLIFITIIFTLDRVSKIFVIYLSDKSTYSEIFTTKFLNISLIWNEGVAFGLFSFDKNYLYNLLTVIISLVIFVIFVMMVKSDGVKKNSLIMIFGGAIGNLYDRIFYKAVPDFIDLHIEEFHWFIFNIADIFITVGVIFMILFELINKNDNEKI